MIYVLSSGGKELRHIKCKYTNFGFMIIMNSLDPVGLCDASESYNDYQQQKSSTLQHFSIMRYSQQFGI